MIRRLLRLLDSLRTYPNSHVHREVEWLGSDSPMVQYAQGQGLAIEGIHRCLRCTWLEVC